MAHKPRVENTRSAPPSPSARSSFRFESATTSFDDLDLPETPSTAVSKPHFCCQDFPPRSNVFDKFFQIGCGGASPFKGSVKSIGQNCQHVIVVVPIGTSRSRTSDPRENPARYFAFLGDVSNYQEIDSILSTYLLETAIFDEITEIIFTCPTHRQTYRLVRHDHADDDDSSEDSDSEGSIYEHSPVPSLPAPITEGIGECRPPLSPHQLSLEKRKFMVRKLSYGRKDEMKEIVKTVVIQHNDQERREKLGLAREERNKEVEGEVHKMVEYEVKYCLERMRIFFVGGRACCINERDMVTDR